MCLCTYVSKSKDKDARGPGIKRDWTYGGGRDLRLGMGTDGGSGVIIYNFEE